ncbi:MAG TPA: glycosyltransferase family 4 protein [Microbacterium sp.]|uniref:glycosyltransferase family 4 protein n=1 Tax=Microbacterium sp. TaxID=51671 RepID=UPI002CDEB8B8|nr:glycosyltransferase family 4 protein [Microbacterium sp.]HWI31654.1 glycosyltransferase family 4 protein [Microbacterium sp.]
MRVLILTTSLSGGGAEFVARTWASWLGARGHDVRVLTTSGCTARTLEGGARARALEGRGHLGAVRALRAELTRESADVVLALQSYPNLVAIAALGARRSRPALIVSERNITTREHEPVGLGERLKMWLARRLYHRADLGIAVSHPVAAQLVSAFGMRGGQVVVVPNPSAHSAEVRAAEVRGAEVRGSEMRRAEAPGADAPRTEVREADGIPLHLVLPLRLVPQKRVELAVTAAALLRAGGADARLLCFGQGPGRPALEASAHAAAVPLSLRGWVEDWVAETPPGSIVVLPSYREGFGNVLVEAALGGIPSVAISNSYGVADALVPSITGELALTGTPEAVAAAVLRARSSSMRHVSGWAQRFSTDESGRLLVASLHKAIARRDRA